MSVRNVLGSLAPLHPVGMPLEAWLGGGWMWVTGRTWEPGFCCPLLSTGNSSPEAGNGQIERISCGPMPWGTWGPCYYLLQIKSSTLPLALRCPRSVLLGAEPGSCHLSLLHTGTTPASRSSSSWLLSLRAMGILKVS